MIWSALALAAAIAAWRLFAISTSNSRARRRGAIAFTLSASKEKGLRRLGIAAARAAIASGAAGAREGWRAHLARGHANALAAVEVSCTREKVTLANRGSATISLQLHDVTVGAARERIVLEPVAPTELGRHSAGLEPRSASLAAGAQVGLALEPKCPLFFLAMLAPVDDCSVVRFELTSIDGAGQPLATSARWCQFPP